MRCENCDGYATRSDRYCKRCGAELRNARLPVKRAPMQPAIWRQAAPVLARGAALVALGVVAEAAIRALAKGVLRPSASPPARSSKLPARKDGAGEGVIAVSETVVMRRVVVRR
jgi:hypothetical protein